MTDKQIDIFLENLSVKKDSKLRNLFYTAKGLPRYRTYTKIEILKKLGLDISKMNTLEIDGALFRLNPKLTYLRNEAKKHGLAWTDWEPKSGKGHEAAYHGFTDDAEKIDATIEKYNGIANEREEIAHLTEKVCKQNLRLITNQKKAG
jgi:hypothetical protein